MKTFKDFMEDAPINNVGGGNIAGTPESGDHPPVRKKKKRKVVNNKTAEAPDPGDPGLLTCESPEAASCRCGIMQ